MAEHKILQGILALIDIVNFTPQATKLGKKYTAEYTGYFQEKIKTIANRHGFRVIKSMGDAVLLFGTDVEGLLEIMLDFFEREKPEDRYGFVSRFRMVAHSGFFQFKMKNRQPVDLVSPEGIKVFRMEKYAQSWELVVTQALYQGIKSLLTQKNIESGRLVLGEPLKGFDNEEWNPPFYRLKIAREEESVSNLLEPRMEKLEQEVQNIPVFGNIYPPVPMENNFINLSMVCDDERQTTEDGRQGTRMTAEATANEKFLRGGPGGAVFSKSAPPGRRRQERDWPFHEYELEREKPIIQKESDVATLYDRHRSGVILGLPGAGKTTILRYLAYREFQANKTKTEHKRQVVLFVPCRDIPLYETWYYKRHGTELGEPDQEAVLEFLTWVFLFGKTNPNDLTPEQGVEFQDTGKRVKQAWKEDRVTLLVDALDESADSKTMERIKQLFIILYNHLSQNRLYLTSRPAESIHLEQDLKQYRVAVFKVLSLTQDQVRAVARHIMEEDSVIYKKFDQEFIWQEEVVVKIAATPIIALLVTAYFLAYEKFDLRYPMYDLLVKFILLKVWDNIKTGGFPYRNLELFFQEVKRPGFFKSHRETWILYNALALLCHNLFYDSKDGIVQRSVNESTLDWCFAHFIKNHMGYYDDEGARAEAALWRERFRRDHLLLQAGKQEYVFVHSTVMEYLAAYHMVELSNKDKEYLPGLVEGCVKQKELLELETISIAAGSSLLAGYAILAELRQLIKKISYPKELLYFQGIKCLAEVEWLLEKTFRAIRIKRMEKPVLDIVNRNYQSVHWVYSYLKDLVLDKDKEQLKQTLERIDQPLRLSRDTLMEEYLDFESFNKGDSQLVNLRKELLDKLVQREPLQKWYKSHKEKVATVQPGEPAVEEIRIFSGHKAFVWGCAFSLDGTRLLSASADKTLKLWDAASGKEMRTLTGHKYPVWSCAFSPDGTRLLSASDDKTLKLWDAVSGKEMHTFTGHKAYVNSCAFSPDGTRLLSASSDQTLKLWDAVSGKEMRTFSGHKAGVISCAFSPDGTRLLSTSDDRTLKLWDVGSGNEIRIFIGHKATVSGCAFSPDGTHLLSASYDLTLKLWDVGSGKEIRTFSGHEYAVNSCAFSSDGTCLISASNDRTLKLWNTDSGQCIKTQELSSVPFYVAVSPNPPHLVVTANRNGTLSLFDFKVSEVSEVSKE